MLATPAPVEAAACGIPTCTLTVVMTGTGSGSWKTTNSSHVPNGFIDCQMVNGVQVPGSDCTHTYGGEDRVTDLVIYYGLYPATGSNGCVGVHSCAPTTQYSQFTLLATGSVSGRFELALYPVAVSRSGSGTGRVGSSPSGIDCAPTCAANFAYGTELMLFPYDYSGSYFAGWTGACAGQIGSCFLTVTGPVDTTATFNLGSPPTASPPAPTPTATAAATPKVTVKPTATPGPGASSASVPTASTASQAPAGTASASGEPASTGGATAAPGTLEPPASTASSVAATEPASGTVSAPAADLTPVALAILAAGLLIAIGIGVAAFMLRRRSTPPA